MLVVVRHAEAETRVIGGPTENDRPLTERECSRPTSSSTRCWNDPDLRYGTGETHRELTARATAALRELLRHARSGPVVAAAHGTWITRGFEGLGLHLSPDSWAAMPNPAVYVLTSDGSRVSGRGPGLAAD